MLYKPSLVGDDCAGSACCLALYGDLRIGHGETGGIGDDSRKVRGLRDQAYRNESEEEQPSNSDTPHCGDSFHSSLGLSVGVAPTLAAAAGTPAAFNAIGGTNGVPLELCGSTISDISRLAGPGSRIMVKKWRARERNKPPLC